MSEEDHGAIARAIIGSGLYMVLGTPDEADNPWTSPARTGCSKSLMIASTSIVDVGMRENSRPWDPPSSAIDAGRQELRREAPRGCSVLRGPAQKHDLRIGRVHPVPMRIGIPGDQVAAGDAAHNLVRASDDSRKRGAGALPITGS